MTEELKAISKVKDAFPSEREAAIREAMLAANEPVYRRTNGRDATASLAELFRKLIHVSDRMNEENKNATEEQR